MPETKHIFLFGSLIIGWAEVGDLKALATVFSTKYIFSGAGCRTAEHVLSLLRGSSFSLSRMEDVGNIYTPSVPRSQEEEGLNFK